MPRALAAGEVHVHGCRTGGLDEGAVRAVLGLLSEEERQRAARLPSEAHRRDFVTAHALLRQVLALHHPVLPAAWTFTAQAGGKPVLTGELAAASGLGFNLTHTDGFVACAVVRGAEVGVDVEVTDRRTAPVPLARRFFTPREADELARLPEALRPGRFAEVWTLKEACAKATGLGLTLPLVDYAFLSGGVADGAANGATDVAGGEPGDGPSLRLVTSGPHSGECWRLTLLTPSPRYRLAVAVLAGPGGPAAWRVRTFETSFAPDGTATREEVAYPQARRVESRRLPGDSGR